MAHFKAIIKGRVQGVGYRYFAYEEALMLEIKGWVKNLRSGEVEIVGEGEKKDLECYLEALKKGPYLSQVTDIDIEWFDTDEKHKDFIVKY